MPDYLRKAFVGSVEVIALSDTSDAYPAASVYPKAGEALSAYADRLTADGRLELNFACFLVSDGNLRLLVDTGLGPRSSGRLLQQLHAAGVHVEEVEVVLFTHLHGDHTGWNIDQQTGKPTFSKARYLVPKGDWDFYSSRPQPPSSFTRDVLPLEASGQLELIAGEYGISSSLTTLPTPGHTPGHTSLVIASGGERGIVVGDVVLSTIDVERPDWDNSFDSDHELARRTRLALLDRLEKERALAAPSHLPDPALGRVVRLDGRRAWQPQDFSRL